MRPAICAIFLAAWAVPVGADGPGFVLVRSYDAPAARQAVAADAAHFYAIGNHAIEKYARATGERVALWQGAPEGPIVHLNSGVLVDGELWCAHSNHPGIPMTSSIERFDPETLVHLGSHSFGIAEGSATWVAVRDGARFVAFAHYGDVGGGGGKTGGQPGRGPEWTTLVRFDQGWRRSGGWVFPAELVARFAPNSTSGGLFAPDGTLWVTGHDAAEVYVLQFPKAGSVLEWVDTLPAPIAGQGIALDPADPGALWGIVKRERRVVHTRRAAR